jgi:hypothetical protein
MRLIEARSLKELTRLRHEADVLMEVDGQNAELRVLIEEIERAESAHRRPAPYSNWFRAGLLVSSVAVLVMIEAVWSFFRSTVWPHVVSMLQEVAASLGSLFRAGS